MIGAVEDDKEDIVAAQGLEVKQYTLEQGVDHCQRPMELQLFLNHREGGAKIRNKEFSQIFLLDSWRISCSMKTHLSPFLTLIKTFHSVNHSYKKDLFVCFAPFLSGSKQYTMAT